MLAAAAALVWSFSPARADDSASKKGATVTLDGLKSTAPAGWQEQETSNPQMRVCQFRIPAAKGDKSPAELVVFYFGKGGGGSAAENIKRWKGFFIPPEDKKIDDVAMVEEITIGDVKATYLDVAGTYKFKAQPFNPNAKEELRPDWRMLGVVFQSPNGPYFIRLVGPAKTVAEHKKEFDDWLKGFK
jgi:hypothetical protein